MNNYGSRYYEDEELDELKGRIAPPETDLQRGIKALGAVEVAPHRYAYKTGDGYAIATTQQVEGVAIIGAQKWKERALDYDAVTLMPSWWTPQDRFACKSGDLVQATYRYVFDCPKRLNGEALVTADLETGAEIPA